MKKSKELLKKQLRNAKLKLSRMESENYQRLISGQKDKYSTEVLQKKFRIINDLQKRLPKNKTPRTFQIYRNGKKIKTIETNNIQDFDKLLLNVENTIEQVIIGFDLDNLIPDLKQDLWNFWLRKKLKIINGFNHRKNRKMKFNSYLYRCFKNRVLYELDHKYKNQGMVCDFETINVAEALQTFQQWHIDHTFNYVVNLDDETLLDEKLAFIRSRLNEEQLEILELKSNGWKYQEIADKFKVTRQTIFNRIKKIQSRLFNKDRANFIQFAKMKIYHHKIAM